MSVTFNDIRAMLQERPPIAWTQQRECDAVFADLESQGITFSEGEKAAIFQCARLQNAAWPRLNHPRAALFASAYDGQQRKTAETVRALAQGANEESAMTALCALNNADLRVYELDLENAPPEGGLDEVSVAHAISYGLMVLDEKVDVLVVSSISAGSATALAKIAADTDTDALAVLARHGGQDLCALVGAVLAARMAKVPVLCGPQVHTALTTLLHGLLPGEDSVLVPLPQAAWTWPEAIHALRQLYEIKVLLAPGPHRLRQRLTQLAEAA